MSCASVPLPHPLFVYLSHINWYLPGYGESLRGTEWIAGQQDNRTTEKHTHVGGGRGGKYSAAGPKGRDRMEWERISWFDGLIGHNVRSDHRYRFCHFTFV